MLTAILSNYQVSSAFIKQHLLMYPLSFLLAWYNPEGTGRITLDNLKKACKEAGVKFTEQELRDMIEEADRNGDNEVDLQEFTNVMLKTNLF